MINQFHNSLQKDAHAKFQNWRKENMEGFFLNVKTKKSGIIHRSDCWHPGSVEWQASELGDLGKQMKVCSLNLNAIHQWAKHNGLTDISECADCKPFDDQRIMAEIAEDIFKEFNPDTVSDERRRALRDIVSRQGQPVFRKALLHAYDARCSITGCNVIEVLEAAHITQYQGQETNHITNGLLLRSDIHTLFDLHLLTVHPETLQICLNPILLNSPYSELAGKTLREPIDPAQKPSRLALERHFDSCSLE